VHATRRVAISRAPAPARVARRARRQPSAALCFEAKPMCPARHLAYLRPPSRLTRAHDRPASRAPPSRHGRRLGELWFLLTPPVARPSNALARSHRSSEDVLPHRPPSLAGRRAARASAAGYHPTPSPRPPRSQLRAQIDQR
jgi:hypothetical protein